jgi:hypothetical protein
MLAEHGILAISPELGTMMHESESFFLNELRLEEVLRANYVWIFNSMKKLGS